MNPGTLKVVVIGIFLTVLAFIVGSQAASSSREAYMTLGGIGFLFLLLVIGKRCWWLLFMLPPLASRLPMGALSSMPLPYMIAPVVLMYWVIMWCMGYVRVTWHGHRWIDGIFFLVMAYLAFTFYRNPVSVNYLSSLGIEADMLGGEPYVVAVGAILLYITLSIIPTSIKELHQVLKYTYIIHWLIAGFMLARYRAMPFGLLATTIFCYYPLSSIILSPWKFALLFMGFYGAAASGQRSQLASWVVAMVFMSSVWKNFLLVSFLGCASIGVVYFASSQKLLLECPPSVQRALSSLPGIEIDENVRASSEHSSEWRYVMWRWAFDPRSGLIKNYVWGDGCGQSVKEMEWDNVLLARGAVSYGDQQQFAERGVWHNGAIELIHRIGYVGLALVSLLELIGLFLLWRTCRALVQTTFGFFFCMETIEAVGHVFTQYVGDGHLAGYMRTLTYLPLLKVVYTLLQKEGVVTPLFQRQVYIPLAIREHEAEQQRILPGH